MLATKSNSYTFQKSGVWYFSCRVRADLWRHYRTTWITYSLSTKTIRDARVSAMSDGAKLDRHWHIMRMSSDDVPGKHLLEEAEPKGVGQGSSLSDAVALYLRLKECLKRFTTNGANYEAIHRSVRGGRPDGYE